MHRSSLKREKSLLLFILPAFVLYTVFVIGPAVSSIYLSFTSWDGITDATMKFIGLGNYIDMFKSARFYGALKHTVLIAVSFTVLANAVALLLALMVDNVKYGKSFFRSAFYVPVLISGIITGFIWSIMFNYSFGIVNSVLSKLHLDFLVTDFLGRSPNALVSIIFVLVWQLAGYYMVIYLAGLQGIPVELVEAAKIDGANKWQQFKSVTFPLLAGSFTINLTLALINGFKFFDQILVMTDGGPGFDTENLTYIIYKVAFGELRQGYGTALAIILFLIIIVLGTFQVRFLRTREVQL
jgi:multiple sugar transport system permease protein/raffinose/stachyose/melibiose transport system permease protein